MEFKITIEQTRLRFLGILSIFSTLLVSIFISSYQENMLTSFILINTILFLAIGLYTFVIPLKEACILSITNSELLIMKQERILKSIPLNRIQFIRVIPQYKSLSTSKIYIFSNKREVDCLVEFKIKKTPESVECLNLLLSNGTYKTFERVRPRVGKYFDYYKYIAYDEIFESFDV